MDEETVDKVPSPAVDRALTILETLVEARSPMTLTALAAEAGIPLATCAAIMQTFEARGYASRRIVGRSHFWRPTLKLNGLVAEYMRGIDLSQIVQPYLQELMGQTQMAAHVGLLEGNKIVYAAKVAAPGLVQFDTYPGKTEPFNLTALGQAVVAFMPAEQIESLLTHLVQGSGPRARPPTADEMRSHLAQVRERGYAIEDEEEEVGVGCLAAPFFDSGGQVLGSVGVTGFVDQVREPRLSRNADYVVGVGRQLSQEFGQGLAATSS